MNTQLCTISADNRTEGKFSVDAYCDDGKQFATFECEGERAAILLRTAIRDHAVRLRRVADFRVDQRAGNVPKPAAWPEPPHPAAAEKHIRTARELLLGQVKITKTAAIDLMLGGDRDFAKLRAAVESYIDMQTAADKLGETA